MNSDKFKTRLYKIASVITFILASVASGLFIGGSTIKIILSFILPSSGHGIADGLEQLFLGGFLGASVGLLFSLGFLGMRQTTERLFVYSSWAILIAVVNMSITMFLIHVVGVSW